MNGGLKLVSAGLFRERHRVNDLISRRCGWSLDGFVFGVWLLVAKSMRGVWAGLFWAVSLPVEAPGYEKDMAVHLYE